MFDSLFGVKRLPEEVQEDAESPDPVVGCSKELISRFEKMLYVSNGGRQSHSPSLHHVSNGLKKRKKKKKKKEQKVKKAFALRPSKLDLSSFPRQGRRFEEHFSFETCSKELESIIQKSSGQLDAKIRPRSSSLPSSSKAFAKSSRLSSPPPPYVTFGKGKFLHRGRKSDYVPSRGVDKHCLKRKGHKPVESASCAQQARRDQDLTQDIDRITDYLEESILLPKKMSYMAEMMYT